MPNKRVHSNNKIHINRSGRKSFYYHFRDKYDLINWIFHTEFFQAACSEPSEDGWTFILGICRYFYANHTFYKKAFEITGQNSFRDYFQEILEPILLQYSPEMFDFDNPPDFFITFISDALIVSMVRWLSAKDCLEPDIYVEQLRACCGGMLGSRSN